MLKQFGLYIKKQQNCNILQDFERCGKSASTVGNAKKWLHLQLQCLTDFGRWSVLTQVHLSINLNKTKHGVRSQACRQFKSYWNSKTLSNYIGHEMSYYTVLVMICSILFILKWNFWSQRGWVRRTYLVMKAVVSVGRGALWPSSIMRGVCTL